MYNWKHISQDSDNYCIFTEILPWWLQQNQWIACRYGNLAKVTEVIGASKKCSIMTHSCVRFVFRALFQIQIKHKIHRRKKSDSASSPNYDYFIIFLHICFSAPLDLGLVVLSRSNTGSHKCIFYRLMSLMSMKSHRNLNRVKGCSTLGIL